MLKYAPTNEQEVIYLFARKAKQLGLKVLRLQSEFPDAILLDQNNKELRAEFEYKSSNFIHHRHPSDACDIVICWIDDSYLPNNIRVIALQEYFPQLKPSPLVSEEDARANKTAMGLALIKSGRADKAELLKLFKMYHTKEQEKEPVRFIARLISNGGGPIVEHGILKLRNKLPQSDMKYAVKDMDEFMDEACRILEELGFNFSSTNPRALDLSAK